MTGREPSARTTGAPPSSSASSVSPPGRCCGRRYGGSWPTSSRPRPPRPAPASRPPRGAGGARARRPRPRVRRPGRGVAVGGGGAGRASSWCTGTPGSGKTRLVDRAGSARRGGRAPPSPSSQCFGASGRLAWPRSPSGCAAPSSCGGPAGPRPGLARGGRAPAAVAPAPPGGGRDEPASDGRRLAAAPLLRGAGPGPARARPADPARARQPAVVRPGDARLPDVPPRAGGRGHPCWWPSRCARQAWTASRSWPGWIRRMRAADLRHRGDAGPPGRPATPAGWRSRSAAAPSPPSSSSCCRRPPGASRCTWSRPSGPSPTTRPAGELPSASSRRRAARGGLTAVLHNRLEQSSPTAQEVAGLAAAVGRDFTLEPARRRPATWTPTASCGPSTSCGGAGSWSSGARLRLLPRPAARRGLRPGEPAAALAAPPPARAEPGAAARRRPRPGLGPAGRAVRQGRPAREGGGLLPPRRRASPPACSRTARRSGCCRCALAIVRAQPAAATTQRQELALLEAIAAPLNALRGYSSKELQAVIEASVALAESLGRRDSLLNGLVGLWASLLRAGARAREPRRGGAGAGLLATRLRPERGGRTSPSAAPAMALGRLPEALRHLELAAASSHGTVAQHRHPP